MRNGNSRQNMDYRKPAAVTWIRRWLLGTVLAVAVHAGAETAYFNLQTPTPNPSAGQTVYQLMMRAPAASVAGLDLRLSYRPSTALLAAVTSGPLVAGMSWAVNTNEPGTIRMGLAGANSVGGEGMVLALAFNTIEPVTVDINQALVNEGAIASLITVNTAPTVSGPASQVINELATLVFTNLIADSDVPANRLSLSLVAGPFGLTMTPAGIATWTPAEAQGPSTNDIIVRVTDNGVPSLSNTRTIQIIVNEVNVAPVLNPIGNKSVNEGTLLTFTATATDADIPAQALTFSLGTGAPTGAAITSGGAFSWTPTEAQGPSTNLVTIRVSDGVTNASETITIVVNEVNSRPALGLLTNQTVRPNQTVTFVAAATDEDFPVQTLSFTLDTAPPGAAIEKNTGLFTWMPTANQAPSTNAVVVRVTDDGSPSLSDTKTFTIVVSVTTELRILSVERPVNGQVELRWRAESGAVYEVVFKDQLSDPTWTSLGQVLSVGDAVSFMNSMGTARQRFYLIKQVR